MKINDKVTVKPFCYVPKRSWRGADGAFYDLPSGKVFRNKDEKRKYYEAKGYIEH